MLRVFNTVVVFLIFLLTLPPVLKAQNSGDAGKKKAFYKSLMSPAPNASSLGRFADYPVEGYSGNPNIKIPLYEVKIKDFSLPIELSYNASGVKVDDIASWVGLNWSLNAGGVITRSVQGPPDDMMRYSIFTSGVNMRTYGYLIEGLDSVLTFRDEGLSDMQLAQNVTVLNGNPWRFDENGNWVNYNPPDETRFRIQDTEPDIFYYTFGDKTGKFFFGKDKKPKFVPYENFVASYEMSTERRPASNSVFSFTNLGIYSFRIRDEKGNLYTFANIDSTMRWIDGKEWDCFDLFKDQWVSTSRDIPMVSSWYLSSIVTSNNDTVKFHYTLELLRYHNVLKKGKDKLMENNELVQSNIFSYFFENTTYSNRLTRIETPYEDIYFLAEHDRQDVARSKALTGLEVKRKDNKLLKKYELNYEYFECTAEDQVATGKRARPTIFYSSDEEVNPFKRLKLKSIKQKSYEVLEEVPPYIFEYEEGVKLPPRLSFEKDFWGYFNNNDSKNPFPTLYIYPNLKGGERISIFNRTDIQSSYILPGAYMECNPTAILAGSLKKIIFPTGGYTEFYFEPHEFYYGGTNRRGGGLRLKTTLLFDGTKSASEIIKNYTYTIGGTEQSSGKLLHFPIFGYTDNGTIYQSKLKNLPVVTPEMYPGNSKDYFELFTHRIDQPNSILGSDLGINVGYTEIKEIQSGNGFTINKFNVPGSITDLSDFIDDDCDEVNNPTCDGLFNVPKGRAVVGYAVNQNTLTRVLCHGYDNRGLDFSRTGMPYAPVSNYEWKRGLLQSKEVFTSANKIVSKSEYLYELFTAPTGVDTIRGILIMPALNYSLKNSLTGGGDYADQFTIYSKFNLLAGVSMVLKKEITKTYDENAIDFVESSTENFYESKLKQPSKAKFVNSDGRTIIKNYKYVSDVNATGTAPEVAAIAVMQQKNDISDLLENYTQLIDNGTTSVVDGSIFTYKNYNPAAGIVQAYQQFSLKSKIPLNDYTPFSIASGTFLKDSRYNLDGTFNYNDKSLLIEQTKANDIKKSYLYDPKYQLPKAEIINGDLAQVRYTSFEDADNGGWYVNGKFGSVVPQLDPTAPTGLYCLAMGNIDAIIANGLNAGKSYRLSFWMKNGGPSFAMATVTNVIVGPVRNGWTYYEYIISGSSEIEISGTGYMDELRLYPRDATMSTIVHDPLIGIHSLADINNKVTYYEYDALGRLRIVRNEDRYVIKKICYSYYGQTAGMNDCKPAYWNSKKSQSIRRSNCGTGMTGSLVVYTVPEGKYTSEISQEDADNKALLDIIANGQAYADANGTCSETQTVYARISYENPYYYYADVVVRFFKDPQCTIPLDVSGLQIYVTERVHNVSLGTDVYTPHTFTCNGSVMTLFTMALLYQESGGEIERSFYLESNAAYVIRY